MYNYYVCISFNNILLLGHACQNFQCNTLQILGRSGPNVYLPGLGQIQKSFFFVLLKISRFRVTFVAAHLSVPMPLNLIQRKVM